MLKRELLIYEHRSEPTLLTIGDIERLAGIHVDVIRRLYRLGLIDPYVEKPRLLFEDSVISRIGVILRLKNDLDLNLQGCGLVLDLLERINQLEKQVRYYERLLRR